MPGGVGVFVVFFLLLAAEGGEDAPGRVALVQRESCFAPLDVETLPRLMKARGFRGGRDFKALVIRVERDEGGGFRYVPYAYGRRSARGQGWWPASSVKLFAAVGALETTRRLGFSPAAEVVFRYGPGDAYDLSARRRVPLPSPMETTVEQLVRAAITASDNLAFDQLVELAGFDELNGTVLAAERGFRDTVLLRSYTHRIVDPRTHRGLHRDSPPVDLREGARSHRLAARQGTGSYACPRQGNCTTLWELADGLRRVMLHEEIPVEERFRLGPEELALLRSALETPKPRGTEVADRLRAAFSDAPLRLFHKPGFALKWFCDVVFVHRTDTGQRWLVAMVNRPGRASLNQPARVIGALLAAGLL